ncbi:citrulline utilization hydrolase CtlX [Aliiroseovarius sp. PrR006]|uniref:citrulline utilization hydrolase CtlX n=1 Tax=Aliiroseovarius sp. PrR006 TaxID=2706883 RepID=UPI0013D1A8A9|nr:arginine deiminase-related protein [Aliiroseovarius sp. PrR006]NDW53086.1 amidinotransferase [Aliiroseovarius sp. PrR006]
MPQTSLQAPDAVIMIRPHHFQPNAETAQDNGFQTAPVDGAGPELAKRAQDEVTGMVDALRSEGIEVNLFEDPRADRPDAVFPNNWFSTHPGGHVAVYPMYSKNRRIERRQDVLEMLKMRYRVQDIIDYSGLEQDGLFLEGTGAMVLDHVERVAYAARSKRTSEVLLERFCTHFNYEPMVFDAHDADGLPIYHTNVLMCIGTDMALIGLDTILDTNRRDEVRERLARGGRDVIALSQGQIASFAGNAIELQGREGRILAMSRRAFEALEPEQKWRIEAHLKILPLEIPTLEMAGGSVRCTIAGIHLSPRPTAKPEGAAA